MSGRIEIGVPISTENIPSAFFKWLEDTQGKYEFCKIEIRNAEIQVIRVKTPVAGIKAVEDLKYGTITSDSSGVFLEKTFIPRYSRDRDEIILEQ